MFHKIRQRRSNYLFFNRILNASRPSIYMQQNKQTFKQTSKQKTNKQTNKQTNTIKTEIKHINTHTKPIITARKRKIINL